MSSNLDGLSSLFSSSFEDEEKEPVATVATVVATSSSKPSTGGSGGVFKGFEEAVAASLRLARAVASSKQNTNTYLNYICKCKAFAVYIRLQRPSKALKKTPQYMQSLRPLKTPVYVLLVLFCF